jgi:hypothetical protein
MNSFLKIVLDMTTHDIKANRIAFGKLSRVEDVQEIFRQCWKVAAGTRGGLQ